MLVPVIVELGGDPDLGAGDAGGPDAFTNLGLITVGDSTDLAVSKLQYYLGSLKSGLGSWTYVSI